jgi:hypothetical protein
VLAVVQDEEQLSVAQDLGEGIGKRLCGPLGYL